MTKRLFVRIRKTFHDIFDDGLFHSDHWQELAEDITASGLDLQQITEFLQSDALALLDENLARMEECEMLSDEIEQLHTLCHTFNLFSLLTPKQQQRLDRLKRLRAIQHGRIEPIEVKWMFQFDEIPYLEELAVHHKNTTSQQQAQFTYGKLIATNRVLYFIPNEDRGYMEIPWKNILLVEPSLPSEIRLWVSRGKGAGYYTVNDPMLVKGYLDTLIDTAKGRPLIVNPAYKKSRHIPDRVKIAVRLRDGSRCVRCGADGYGVALEFDHIIPHSKGGPNTVDNVQMLCRQCNLEKGERSR